jgi:hypothetical protein
MFEFLKKAFKREPTPPRQVDVGRLSVQVEEVDGTKHDLTFTGEYSGPHPFDDSDWVFDANFYFQAWQRRGGERGMLSIGNDAYVPLCNVKRVTVIARNEHVVTVQD